jgi:hypothetical protein
VFSVLRGPSRDYIRETVGRKEQNQEKGDTASTTEYSRIGIAISEVVQQITRTESVVGRKETWEFSI